MVHNVLFYTLEIGNYQNNPLLASIWLAVITRIHKEWEENLFYLSAHPSPSGWRARLSSHTAEDRQMSHQDAFLHIQQHRGAAGDFLFPCKDRRKEKRISSACNFTSSTETVIECRLGGKMPCPYCLTGLVHAAFECCSLENLNQEWSTHGANLQGWTGLSREEGMLRRCEVFYLCCTAGHKVCGCI